MLEFCDELTDANFDAYMAWQYAQDHVYQGILSVEIVSWVAGLVLIFGWWRREAKSRFIWVLWTLITLFNLILIAMLVFDAESIRAYKNGDYDRYLALNNYYVQLEAVNQCLVVITHWNFAIKYFEVVFEFPLIFAPQDDHIRARKRCLRCGIWSANASFYTTTGLWLLGFFLLCVYPIFESVAADRATYKLQITLNVIRMIPAVLLVFAVQKLRGQIEDFRGLSVREQLMRVHTVVFVCNICFNLASGVSGIIFENGDRAADWTLLCHSIVSYDVLLDFAQVTNVITLWLIIFMSLQLSKPLTRGWSDSVHSHQGEDLGDFEERHRSAERIHAGKVSDANHTIKFFQALIKREEEGTESQASPRESLIVLNTEERAILDDSSLTDSSSLQFARVRGEEAERLALFGSVNNPDDESIPDPAED